VAHRPFVFTDPEARNRALPRSCITMGDLLYHVCKLAQHGYEMNRVSSGPEVGQARPTLTLRFPGRGENGPGFTHQCMTGLVGV